KTRLGPQSAPPPTSRRAEEADNPHIRSPTVSAVAAYVRRRPGPRSSAAFLPADHQMRQPKNQPGAGIVLHGAQLGRRAERIGNTLGRPFVVGREADPDMAIVQDRVVFPISLLDLIEALRDQEGADAVAGLERKRRLEEIQPPECWKLVEHHEQA